MLLLFDASSASNCAWSPLSTHVMPSAGLLSLTTLMTTLLPAKAQTRRRSLCNMHGIYNATIRRCECAMGWTGGSCDEKLCPEGYDWLAPPSEHHIAHDERVECSGVGDCDRTLGVCTCKRGFTGAGCEMMECPLGPTNSTGEVQKTCSGHGRCLTLAQMGGIWTGNDNLDFDGAVFKPRDYDLWDADQIRGCVCDPPYTGFNCSLKACPVGDDYTQPRDKYGMPNHNEVMRIECAASRGSFRFTFRGETSDEIPYNAPYGRVKHILESMSTISSISLAMSSATVCAHPLTTTTISFLDQVGEMPAAKVTPQKNMDTDGVGNDAIIRMNTKFVLNCPRMPSVRPDSHSGGGLHFKYDGETTRFVNYTASVVEVESALRNLTTLRHHSDYGHINVTAAGSSTGICSALTNVNTTIEFKSQYGNLHELEVIDGMKWSHRYINFTVTSPKATTRAKECSNRGMCNYKTGTCECFYHTTLEKDVLRRMVSSDGNKNAGTKGDCGYAKTASKKCPAGLTNIDDPLSLKPCFDNGFCDNSTHTCRCAEGFMGADCSMRKCAEGVSWFDSIQGDGHAHQTKRECSGQGTCEREGGKCLCAPGFTGEACDKTECGIGIEKGCGAYGRCLPLWKLAEYKNINGENKMIAYGNSDEGLNGPETWDRNMFWSCLCDGGNPKAGPQGPAALYVSGIYIDKPMTLGYEGYACNKAVCPHGDDPDTPGVNEIQRVDCTATSGTFTLRFRDITSLPIAFNANAATVKTELEKLGTINSVTVTLVGAQACLAVNGGFWVEFTGNPGDLPAIITTPTYNVTEHTKGTKEFLPCSNRGTCFTNDGPLQGLCNCHKNYMTSDGNGARGTLRDCGKYDEFGAAVGYFTT